METKDTEAGPLGDLVWYFAYGSNMSSQKFSEDRGIKPFKEARMRLPGWKLAFNIPGLPYSEPSFASIVPQDPSFTPEARSPEVLGVAYLITQDQYIEVLASEGGGIAYEDIQVEAVPVSLEDANLTGPQVSVRTLGAAMERKPWPCPSKRYMVVTPCEKSQFHKVANNSGSGYLIGGLIGSAFAQKISRLFTIHCDVRTSSNSSRKSWSSNIPCIMGPSTPRNGDDHQCHHE